MGDRESYWLCLGCETELHNVPEFAEPTKCSGCGGSRFQKMNRMTVSLENWKGGSLR